MWRVNIFGVHTYFRNFTECRQCRPNLGPSYLSVSLCTFDKQPLVLYDVWSFLTPDSEFQFFVCFISVDCWYGVELCWKTQRSLLVLLEKSNSWTMGSDAISFTPGQTCKVKTQLHTGAIGGGFHVCPPYRTVCCYGYGGKNSFPNNRNHQWK